MRLALVIGLTVWLITLVPLPVLAQQSVQVVAQEFKADFANTADQWVMTSPAAWKVADGRLSLFLKESTYQPSVRSPRHIAWLKEHRFGSFQLDVKVLSTEPDYNHRDACLFFGGQSPTQYYYVHFGKQADPHANQVFIVDDAERKKISLTTTSGTPWDNQWHHLRLVRDIASGDIRVYFDDMQHAVMTAQDKTFGHGSIGLGSFDDRADFDDLVVQPKSP